MGCCNSREPGYSNMGAPAVPSNGHANGHSNGHANGHGDGHHHGKPPPYVPIPPELVAHLMPLVPIAPSPDQEFKAPKVPHIPGVTFGPWNRSDAKMFAVGLPALRMGLVEPTTWANVNDAFAAVVSSQGHEPKKGEQALMYFTRHGQGLHNLMEDEYNEWRKQHMDPPPPPPEWDDAGVNGCQNPILFDANLTELGIKQAEGARQYFRQALANGLQVDIIVVSPLQRAIRTAMIIAEDIWHKVPVLCLDAARETIGKHTCGMRHTRTQLMEMFPSVNFQFLLDDADLWSPAMGDRQETWDERAVRAEALLEWLGELSKVYPRILYCSHGGITKGVTADLVTDESRRSLAPNATHQQIVDESQKRMYDIDHCEYVPMIVSRPQI